MIHQLLNLSRPLFILDTETTGLTRDAHIVELGFQQWAPEGMIKEWRSLVNPGVPIPQACIDIHGITDDDMLLCQECRLLREDCTCGAFKIVPTFKQLAPHLAKGFVNCDFAGKNVRFDLKIISVEMDRAGVDWNYVGAYIIDAERLEQIAVPRDLGSMHEKYTGRKHDGAHGALSDVRASTTVITSQLQVHEGLPRDLKSLHELSWPGWLVADGSFRLVNGIATCMFGKHNGTAMKHVPVSYWDWLLGAKFPVDVKELVSAAKLGKYPEVTPEMTAAADRRMI